MNESIYCSSKRALVQVAICLTCSLATVQGAGAIAVVVEPPSQTVNLGDPVNLNVKIFRTGVAPSLAAFDFDLAFNPAVLSFNSLAFGDPVSGSLLGNSVSGSTSNPGSGTVNQFEISLESASDLDSLQPDTFILTRLSFTAIASGLSDLQIQNLILSDSIGVPLDATILNGSVNVISSTAVPDASQTAVLLTNGLVALGVCLRPRISRIRWS